MKLTTNATLLRLSELDNDYLLFIVYVTSMDYEINWINKHLSF